MDDSDHRWGDAADQHEVGAVVQEWTLRAHPEDIRTARRLVVNAITDLALEVVETVELLISELATNCVLHAETEFTVRLSRTHDSLRIEVSDQGCGELEVLVPESTDPHGRGLQIVAALSEAWGVKPSGVGKTVWFALSTTPNGHRS